MPRLHLQTDDGRIIDALPSGTILHWTDADTPADSATDLLPLVIDRLRVENRLSAARETSLAVTHCQEAEQALAAGDTTEALRSLTAAVRWIVDRERRRGRAVAMTPVPQKETGR